MNAERLLNAIGEIDERYVAAAAPVDKPRKIPVWVKYASAACICLLIGAAAVIAAKLFSDKTNSIKPIRSEVEVRVLSDEEVEEYGYHEPLPSYAEIPTPKKILSYDTLIVRGKVVDAVNYALIYQNNSAFDHVRAVVTIEVSKVLRGNVKEGERIQMLLPCPVFNNKTVYNAFSQQAVMLRIGTEGIFMPIRYDDNSTDFWSPRVYLNELAPYGLIDGSSFLFVVGEDGGLYYDKLVFKGLFSRSHRLDAVEKYLIEMLNIY